MKDDIDAHATNMHTAIMRGARKAMDYSKRGGENNVSRNAAYIGNPSNIRSGAIYTNSLQYVNHAALDWRPESITSNAKK